MSDEGSDEGLRRKGEDGGEAERWRSLAVVRRGMGLSAAAVLLEGQGNRCILAMRDAAPAVLVLPEGTLLADLGAAAGAWRNRRMVLLNQDAPRPMSVPYADRLMVLGGAVAFPVDGGLVWADRASGPLASDEVDALQEVGRLVDACIVEGREVRAAVARRDGLAATVEGVRAVLAGSSERETVAALAEAVGRETMAHLVLVVLFGEEPGSAMIVGGVGEGARNAVGRSFAVADGMVGLAVRSGVVVPPGGRYQSPMGPVLCPRIPLPLRNGQPLVVLLLGTPDEPVGALVRVGGNPDAPIHGARTLADTAALLIRQFRLRERVARDAMFDALTGLYNRRAFEARLSETFALAVRQRQPLALMMLDADHFKAVNDLHGHLVGDRVLRALTDEIRAGLRDSDFAGRYGGEEFAVVLPNTDANGAWSVAERIRCRVEAVSVPAGSSVVNVTVSAGVASLKSDMTGPQDLVAAADEALYAAKRAGRNRVAVANQSGGGAVHH